MKTGNPILDKSVKFSIMAISYCEELESKKKFIIARQLLKSATSIGANIHESQNAESKADFVHKLKVAAKELEETKYWLELCRLAPTYPFKNELKNKVNELGLILYKIISSSKRNQLKST